MRILWKKIKWVLGRARMIAHNINKTDHIECGKDEHQDRCIHTLK